MKPRVDEIWPGWMRQYGQEWIRDLAAPAINENSATVLGLIPASFDTAEGTEKETVLKKVFI
jgi:hypothetical protein